MKKIKVVQINSTCGIGSTGKICVAVSELLNQENIENYIFYFHSTDGNKNGVECATKSYLKGQAIKSRILGNWGFNSKSSTKRIIKKLQEIKPDIVHLHNLHSHDCNLEVLFSYFKKVNQKLYWTFHDCWAFTGYCMYFSEVGCQKWKTECANCPLKRKYSLFKDRSKKLYNKKKELFSGLDLTIITPSNWMANLVKHSFLKDYPIKVINNGIDLSIFKPTESDFRKKYNIPENKKILLGVAYKWQKRKGIDTFYELAKAIDKNKYQIVLVGENAFKGFGSKNIIYINKTTNQKELAKIYSAADLFVNPTREETLGLVNIEALACGTPVITYNSGGSVEMLDEKCGVVVECDDFDTLKSEIERLCEKESLSSDDCVKKADDFANEKRMKEYYDLYSDFIPDSNLKKTVVQINSTCGIGSTGKICVSVSDVLDSKKMENYVICSHITNHHKNGITISSKLYVKFNALKAHLFGNWGFNSKLATRKLIKKLEFLKPDIVHLHNIHSHDIDLVLLFKYFKKVNQKLYWTFHDCWAFTGYCMHFVMANCDKWKTECQNCPKYKEYSFIFDRSYKNFEMKKELFIGQDLTIITPSKWIADLVKQSFLKDYPVKVINNGIDLSVFKPIKTDFREKHNIPQSKKILLGVSFGWSNKKGLDVFIELAKRLNEEKYQIVLVGTNKSTDACLPPNIISIHRTNNQQELAEIYTAADIFLNPTREEVFGMVNIEALACGTPVISFKTGGSPETIDETCGAVVEVDDINGMIAKIEDISANNPYSAEACIKRVDNFIDQEKYNEYFDLYKT